MIIYRKFNLFVLLLQGSLWIFQHIRDSIPCCPLGGILGRSQIWGQSTSSKSLGHQATLLPWGSLWIFWHIRGLIPRHRRGGILGRSQIWGQCMSPKFLGHQATRQFIGNLTYMYFCRGVVCEYFGRIRDLIPRRPHGGILGRSQIWGLCMWPKPLGHQATWQFIGNLT